MKKIRTAFQIAICLCLLSPSLKAEEGRQFLKSHSGYSDLRRLEIQLVCLKIEVQEKERLKEFQFHQMAQEINRVINKRDSLPRPLVDLSFLDVFNYSLAGVEFSAERQQVVVSVLVNQRFLDQKSTPQQSRFLSECFRLVSQKLAKTFVDYDEYRDLVVEFYPLEYDEDPLVKYQEGGFVWSRRK